MIIPQKLLDEIENLSIEVIFCPYCASKLNRIGWHSVNKPILPTSCYVCKKGEFAPDIKKYIDITVLHALFTRLKIK